MSDHSIANINATIQTQVYLVQEQARTTSSPDYRHTLNQVSVLLQVASDMIASIR